MSNSRFDRVQALFLAAIDLPLNQQSEWLKGQTQEDSSVIAEVVELLATQSGRGDPLEQGVMAAVGSTIPTTNRREMGGLNDMQRLLAHPRSRDEIRGIRIGSYRLIREIGRGGMGVVFEANHLLLDRKVALKVLPGHTLASSDRQRFEREARSAARLHHTNIVPVFDVGEDQGIPFYAMQFIDGRGLDEFVRWAGSTEVRFDGSGQLDGFWHCHNEPSESADDLLTPDKSGLAASNPVGTSQPGSKDGSAGSHTNRQRHWRFLARLGMQAAEALHYAHQQGILHRDIKPSNLLLDQDNNVWITDFGLAKAMGDQDLTATGDLIGTLRYLAPETIRGRSDRLADVYGLGLVLYELITLQRPFEDSSQLNLIQKITESGPEQIERQRAGVPRDLRVIVQKSIERDPALRYRSAGELAADLRRFVEDKPIRARRTTVVAHFLSWARRNRIAATLLSALAMLITTGFVVATLFSIHLGNVVQDQTRQLFESKLNEAGSLRNSGVVGHRFETIAAVKEAARLLPVVNQDEHTRFRLRNELIGALGLTDIQRMSHISKEKVREYQYAYHGGLHRILAHSRDGNHVVLRTEDGEAIWRSPKGRNIVNTSTRISPNGRWVAWTQRKQDGNEYELQVYEVSESGDSPNPAPPRLELQASVGSSVLSHAFDAGNGISFFDQSSRAFTVQTLGDSDAKTAASKRAIQIPVTSGESPAATALSRDQSRLATISYHQKGKQFVATVWELDDPAGSPKSIMQVGFPHATGVTFNHDATEVAISHGFRIDCYLIDESRLRYSLPDNQSAHFAQYSEDGSLLFTSGWGPFTSIWNAAHGTRLLQLPGLFLGHGDFPPDGGNLAIHDGDDLWMYHLATGQVRRRVFSAQPQTGPNAPVSTAFHSAGRLVAMCLNGGIRLGDAVLGHGLVEMPIGRSTVLFDPDGSRMFTFSSSGCFEWPLVCQPGHVGIGPPEKFWQPANSHQLGAWMDADQSRIVYMMDNRKIGVIDLKGRQPPYEIDLPWFTAIHSTDLNHNLVVYGTWTGPVLYDVERKEPIRTFEPETSIQFSRDGRRLYLSDRLQTTCYSCPEFEELFELDPDGAGSGLVALHEDLLLLQVAQPPGVLMADQKTGKPLAVFPTEKIAMPRNLLIDFNSGTNRLLAFGEFSELIRWEVGPVRRQLADYGLDWSPAPVNPKDQVADSGEAGPTGRLRIEIDWGGLRRKMIHDGIEVAIRSPAVRPRVALEDFFDYRLEVDPEDTDLLVERAKLKLRYFKDLPSARADLQRALEIDPNDKEAARLLLSEIVIKGAAAEVTPMDPGNQQGMTRTEFDPAQLSRDAEETDSANIFLFRVFVIQVSSGK